MTSQPASFPLHAAFSRYAVYFWKGHIREACSCWQLAYIFRGQ